MSKLEKIANYLSKKLSLGALEWMVSGRTAPMTEQEAKALAQKLNEYPGSQFVAESTIAPKGEEAPW